MIELIAEVEFVTTLRSTLSLLNSETIVSEPKIDVMLVKYLVRVSDSIRTSRKLWKSLTFSFNALIAAEEFIIRSRANQLFNRTERQPGISIIVVIFSVLETILLSIG